MKKLFTLIACCLLTSAIYAQPILHGDSLHTGQSFNLYDLTNVNTANLAASGANVSWDISGTTATLSGTVDFQDMAVTGYASQYPTANFAMKFTPVGGSALYSLFNISTTEMVEVANNVGTANPVTFVDTRMTLVFPFTFGLQNTDIYQKTGQNQKVILNTYDSYGTLITNSATYTNVVRIHTVDNGNTSYNWWNTMPLSPLFQASSSGFTLWEATSTTTGINELQSNHLFDMYPNPATNELKIINKEVISKIDIFNLVGELQFSTSSSTIDISVLKSGIYFLKAYSDKGSVSEKFIKE